MHLRIRDLRENTDLSQKTIAACLFCSQRAYSTYERGEREIPLSQLCRLAQYENVSLDYLVGLTEEKAPYPRT